MRAFRRYLVIGACCVLTAMSARNGLAQDDTAPYMDSCCGTQDACCDAICQSCCEPCCPVQVWANALFLVRNTTGGQYFSPPKGQWFQAFEDNPEVAWGPSVGVTFCPDACNPCFRAGVEFFAVDGWSTTSQVAGNISVNFPSLPYLPELTVPGNPNTGFGLATFDYESNLYNTELNLYHQKNGWLTMLAGFRWIELGERYNTVFATGNTTPNFSINTNNHLYGLQLGTLANLHSKGPWQFDGWMKAGLYGNSADQDTREDFTSAGGQIVTASDRSSNVAFVGDMGISGRRQLTDHLALRVSYMCLWIQGVALAPEQLDNTDPSNGIATLDSSHGVFYHGGFIGGELLW